MPTQVHGKLQDFGFVSVLDNGFYNLKEKKKEKKRKKPKVTWKVEQTIDAGYQAYTGKK